MIAATPLVHHRMVYVIDDDKDMRKSLHFLLSVRSITAWPFAAAADFLEEIAVLSPAPILLDVRMPNIDGLQMLAILKERRIDWPVIAMSAHGDIPIAVSALKLGAIDFLEKPFAASTLESVLDDAFAVRDRLVGSLQARNEARQLIDLLSKREAEVLTILTEGVPNKAAAHRLGLSVRTVEMHRGRALAKLRLKSIAEFVALLAAADAGASHIAPELPIQNATI